MPSSGFRLTAVACPLTAVLFLFTGCASKDPPASSPARPVDVAPPDVIRTNPAPAPATPTAPAAESTLARPARSPGPPPLVGHLRRDQLETYESWRALFERPYVPDPGTIEVIRSRAAGVDVLLVLGTWCGDSKREVPRFFAIMDAAKMPGSALTIVAVDRTKKDPEGLTEVWNVTRVPTFIFLRNGRELGRVVERTPQGSTLEAEVANALRSLTLF